MKKFILLIFIIFSPVVFSQKDNTPWHYSNLAIQAYNHKDYSEFLKNMKLAYKLSDKHQTYIYNLSIAYLLNNKKEEAFKLLKEGLSFGYIYPLEEDKDFDAVKSMIEFREILRLNQDNKKERVISKTMAILPGKQVIPEGLAFDSDDSTFFVSSVYKNVFYNVDRRENILWSSGDSHYGSISGLLLDKKNNNLWCTFVQQPQSEYFIESADGTSGILCYNLKTKKILHKVSVGKDSLGKHWFGDLTMDSKGNIYTTDSYAGNIYKFSTPDYEPKIIRSNLQFRSLQGLTFTKNFQYLIFADYSNGLFRYDPLTSEIIKIKNLANNTLLGIDGIYYYKNNKVIAVQNGTNPQRIVEISFDENFLKATRFRILEVNNPDFDDITLGTINGNDFYFIANSQWYKFDKKGKIFPEEKFNNILIKRIRLE